MNIIALAIKGLRDAVSRPKMVFVLWLANLLAAVPLYMLFKGAFGAALGRSGLASGLAAKTDMNVIIEVLTTFPAVLQDTIQAALGLILVYEFVSIFLAGGILQTLLSDKPARPFAPVFFAGGGGSTAAFSASPPVRSCSGFRPGRCSSSLTAFFPPSRRTRCASSWVSSCHWPAPSSPSSSSISSR
jgi:hypothetical protein